MIVFRIEKSIEARSVNISNLAAYTLASTSASAEGVFVWDLVFLYPLNNSLTVTPTKQLSRGFHLIICLLHEDHNSLQDPGCRDTVDP